MYRFEVSSPGLDRPLRNQKDFERVLGERLRVTLRNPMNKHSVLLGRLITVTDTDIHLIDEQSNNPQEISVALADIAKAKLEVTF